MTLSQVEIEAYENFAKCTCLRRPDWATRFSHFGHVENLVTNLVARRYLVAHLVAGASGRRSGCGRCGHLCTYYLRKTAPPRTKWALKGQILSYTKCRLNPCIGQTFGQTLASRFPGISINPFDFTEESEHNIILNFIASCSNHYASLFSL